MTYNGARLSALWQINDNWDALLQQNYQNMEADGYFYDYPIGTSGQPLARYQINAFAPAYSKDKYESTAWTLNGKIADLVSMVYTGSYMVRHIDGQQDYSNYMRSAVGSYYACIGTGAGYFNQKNFPNQLTGHPLQCSTPVGNWRDQVRNTHQSHELRFATIQDWRVRGLAGFYWEKFVIDDNMNFNYLGIPQCDQAQSQQRPERRCRLSLGRRTGTRVPMRATRRLRTEREHRLRRRRPARLQAESVLHLHRRGHHSQGAHRDRWHSLLPLR